MLKWILKNSSVAILLRVIAMVTTLVFVSLTSKWMSAKNYGILAMILSVTTLSTTVGTFGQTQYLVKVLSPKSRKDHGEEIDLLVERSTSLTIFFSALVGLATAGTVLFIGYGYTLAVTIGLITVLLSVNSTWSGYARSQDRLVWALGPKDIFWRLTTMVPLAVLFELSGKLTISTVSFVLTASLGVVILIQGFVLGIRWRHILRNPHPLEDRKELAESRDLTFADLGGVLFNSLDVLLVGAIMSPVMAAEYFPANRIALVASFFQLPFQLVLGPRISRFMHDNDRDAVRHLATLSTIVIFVASALAGVALVLLYPILDAQFATFTRETLLAMQVLILGQVLVTALGFPSLVLIMSGHQRLLARQNVFFVFVSPPLLALACLSDSIVVVAAAVSTLRVMRSANQAWYAWSRTHIGPIHLLRKFPSERVE